MADLPEEPRHELIMLWVIRLLLQLLLQLLLSLLLTLAKSEFQELLSTSLLGSLLLKNVLEQVFVPLYESLRVDLSMFNLFLSVSLDSLEQGL